MQPDCIPVLAVIGTQGIATLITGHGLVVEPLGWGWAAFVKACALAWALASDRTKLLTSRIVDPDAGVPAVGAARPRPARDDVVAHRPTAGKGGRTALPRRQSPAHAGHMSPTLSFADHQLKSHVVDELSWAPQVQADHVGVSVVDGAVVLSGQVSSYLEKTAAVRAVLRLRGVTAVADEIVVRHSDSRPDADLARDAVDALDRCAGTHELRTEVVDHWITLTGVTAWDYQRVDAVRAVGAVPGVRGVSNLVTIAPSRAFSPVQARARISAALQRSAAVDAKHVNVGSDGSTIELTGYVRSWAEHRQAGHAAYATPGVTHVDNRLRVVP